jgi:hypothetical protein
VTPEDDKLLEGALAWFAGAESEHKQFEDSWDHQDGLYFGHKRFRESYLSASPRDKDGVLHDGRKEFGAELHIPYTFSTIETIMPRTISNRPRMLWLPRDEKAEANAENVRLIGDAQQQRADYELKLQTTCRSGLKHGLGVQKVYWRREEAQSFEMKQAATGEWVRAPTSRVLWDDPDVEDVDIRDFYWDPYGDSMRTVRKVMHRSWRDTAYVLERVESGEWDRCPLTAEDLRGAGGKQKYQDAWRGRRAAQGLTGDGDRREDIHEVWELHDGRTVVTIVDRRWVVRVIENPFWNWRLPFHIYRPIEVEHRFVGVGVIDPIEDLQRELNWLRTDRRWNAMLKLHATYAYNDGVVDPALLKVGPGNLIPVNGDPRGLIEELAVGDIPNSGYQEESNLQRDIERTTGVDDTVAGSEGGGGASATATGVQLVQAAAGLRIQAYTRRLELELCKPESQHWLALNQQMWRERKIRVPAEPTVMDPDRRWTWRTVDPSGVAGEFDVIPDGGATQPDNIPQQRQDALQAMQLFGQLPDVDRRKLAAWAMEKFGITSPEEMLTAPMQVPPAALDLLKQRLTESGVDPVAAQDLITGAVTDAMDMMEQQQSGRPQAPQEAAEGPQQGM